MNRGLIIVLSSFLVTNSIANVYAQQNILSPLKQFKSGIPAQDVKCTDGYVLVIKSYNGYPYCIRPTSEQRLLVQGWIIPKFENLQTNHNETNITAHQNITLLLNGTNSTNDLGIGIINPRVSSNHPDVIKIVSIGMSPNPIKVGDKPEFTLTYQNISNRTLSKSWGCTVTPLGLIISPSDNVLVSIASGGRGPQCADMNGPIYPNQIKADVAGPDPTYGHLQNMYPLFSHGFYQIMKPGLLQVTMELFLQDDQGKSYLTETVLFDVNATR